MKYFKLYPISTLLVASLIFTISSVFYGLHLYGSSFVQDFGANWLATFLGVIIGVPVVLWTTKYQEGVAEKERRGKILQLLREELYVNLTQLSGWQKSKIKDLGTITLSGFLKDESWKAFSDGGELEWIRDPDLLSDLSWAYSSIRTVMHTSEKYFSFVFMGKTRGDKGQIVRYLLELLEKGVNESCISIVGALKAIDK